MKVLARIFEVYEANMERMATAGFIFGKLCLLYALIVLTITGKSLDQVLISGFGDPHDKIITFLGLVSIPLMGQMFIAGFIGLVVMIFVSSVEKLRGVDVKENYGSYLD